MLSCLVPSQSDVDVDWSHWHLAVEIPQSVPEGFAVGCAHGLAAANPGLNVLVQYGAGNDVNVWMVRAPGPRPTPEERARNDALMFNVKGLFSVFAGQLSQAMDRLGRLLHEPDELFPGGTKPTLM